MLMITLQIYGNTHICCSQKNDEVDVLEGTLLGHGKNNQSIAKYHQDAEDEQKESSVFLLLNIDIN